MGDNKCMIVFSTGKEKDKSLTDFIKEREKEAPLLTWAEPDLTDVNLENSTGRHDSFQPLVKGCPEWSDHPRIVEARLFWDKEALHVIEHGKGCKWARVKEIDGQQATEVMRHQYKVHTIRDRQRFGLGEMSIDRLLMIEYWQGGHLLAWRLIEGKS